MSKKEIKKPITAIQEVVHEVPTTNFLGFDANTLKKGFQYLSAIFFVLTILLSLGAGINADDQWQDKYSNDIVKYYTTFGKDTTALNYKDNLHLYGGVFEFTAGIINKLVNNNDVNSASYHYVRHILIASCGAGAMIFGGLLAAELGGWLAGILTLLIMFFTPSFLGHSLMNPKDIPFAFGYAMSLYYMVRFFKQMPYPTRNILIGLGLGLAISIGVRAGGLLLVAIFGFFGILQILQKQSILVGEAKSKLWLNTIKYGAMVVVAGYIIAVIFWPYALQNPFSNVLKALSEQTKFSVDIKFLYQGEFWWSKKVPSSYPFVWLGITLPLFVFLGWLTMFIFGKKVARKDNWLLIAMLAFAFLFPILYVIYKKSNLYDGWRHLLFVYSAGAALAGLGWSAALKHFSNNRNVWYILLGIFGLKLLDPLIYIAKNRHYPYTYFNPIQGGIKNAFGKYELDYWGTAVKQGVEWMDAQGIIKPNMEKPVTIATNFMYPAQCYLAKYGDKVKVIYTRYRNRNEQQWDYGLFNSRFVTGKQLENGKWPSSKKIHTIDANSVPLLAVIKNDAEQFDFQAFQAAKANDLPSAIQKYQSEVAKYPDSDVAWLGLAQAYLNGNQLPEANAAAEKALEIDPDNNLGLLIKGLYLMNTGKVNDATVLFKRSIEIDEKYYLANFYLAMAYRQQNYLSEAISEANKVLETAPNFKQAYLLIGEIYQQQGNTNAAQQYMNAAQQVK